MKLKTLGQTININDDYIKDNLGGCQKIKKQLIKIKSEFERSKIKEAYPVTRYPIITKPVEQVRIGSHRQQLGNRGNRRYYDNVDDYKTIFNDCLPGKAWVEAHYQDVIPEPTLEISVDGKEFSTNGDYKRGIVKNFMGQYCRPGEGKIRLVKV